MTKSQLYYYEDVLFQLELNLQSIRRELINLLEEYMFNDCFNCNRLKCCCTSDSFRSTSLSIPSSDSAFPDDFNDAYSNAAPPAKTLPTPKWPENKTSNVYSTNKLSTVSIASLNIWIRASIPYVTQSNLRVSFPVPRKVLDHVNYSWPPFPMSIWSDERLKATIEAEDMIRREQERDENSSVAVFFQYFSGRAIPKTMFAC